MSELLIELFSEEIPARLQARAARDLERLVMEKLTGAGFLPDGVKAFAGPRRLTLVASGLPAMQPDRREEKKGPRVGAPDKAVEGFLKSAGLASLDACETRADKKGDYYVAVIDQKGRPTAEIIAGFMPQVIRDFPWPKSMRWGAGSAEEGALRWVRPLHRILCVFDGEVVPFGIAGIASGDETEGHRFMAPGVIQARSFESYAATLKKAKVLLDTEERAALIEGDARTLCEAQGLELIEDQGLLAEVAGLAEWPVVMMGAFDEKFLSVPDEVLIASMRGHQKYFSVRDPRTGGLADRFVCVANIEASDGGAAMRAGYERVLTARLSDAWFLYRQDLKIPLEDRIGDLDRITFFEGLGSVGDKVRRMAALARELAPVVGADPGAAERAARLAKADLTTGMVYEFPELQGLMGRYYALAQEASAAIADAVRDHYKPAGQDDDIPSAPVSIAVALADKIDTLTAFWAIDKKPTGSSDPFALRRAALGVIAIVLKNDIRLELPRIFGPNFRRLETLDGNSVSVDLTQESDLIAFFYDRLSVYLREQGHRHDRIRAVLPNGDGGDDLVLIVRKLTALNAFLDTDDGANLAAGYKRAANILKAEEKKGGLPGVDGAIAGGASGASASGAGGAGASVASGASTGRAVEPAEKALFAALQPAEASAAKAVAGERFEDAMAALASLRGPIDAFFETVTVNADDPALRENRLALLQRFRAATALVADLSQLEG